MSQINKIISETRFDWILNFVCFFSAFLRFSSLECYDGIRVVALSGLSDCPSKIDHCNYIWVSNAAAATDSYFRLIVNKGLKNVLLVIIIMLGATGCGFSDSLEKYSIIRTNCVLVTSGDNNSHMAACINSNSYINHCTNIQM